MAVARPALQASEPTTLRVSVAAVHAGCTARCISAALALAGAAWPPPAFDPLSALAAGTAASAVAERLMAPQDRPNALAAVGRLHLQVLLKEELDVVPVCDFTRGKMPPRCSYFRSFLILPL